MVDCPSSRGVEARGASMEEVAAIYVSLRLLLPPSSVGDAVAENNHPGDAGSENPKVVDDKSVGGNAAAADNILAGVDCGTGDIGDNLDFVQLDVDQHLEEAFAHFDGLPFLTCRNQIAQETAGRSS